MKLRLATRGSPLAQTQSKWVAEQVRAITGAEVELVTITTSGDTLSLDKWATEGNKGLFVKEIEEALLAGKAEFAVHSSKDLPAELPKGLAIAAFPKREDPRDVLVTAGPKFAELAKGSKIGSASLRRQMQLALMRPDLEYTAIRGNVDTRLRKLYEGQCAGVVLAAAGLNRLGRSGVVTEFLDPGKVVPAPGQGALGIEARADRHEVMDALRKLDDAETRSAVECERAFMAAMGGGCRMPLGAYARLSGGMLTLDTFYARADGDKGRHMTGEAPAKDYQKMVAELAKKLA